MTLDDVRRLIADDFAAVDRAIQDELASDVALIEQMGHYIVAGGGKRLRPMVVLLAARACGYPADGQGTAQDHVRLAAVIEFIHTATLLHDDVVDGSGRRRGRDTANTLWGNEAAVLTGDFLYSRAFQMMVQPGSMRVMEIMADATNTIAEGEVMQLLNCHDPSVDEVRYLEVIRRKTATLFEAGTRLGAVVAGADATRERALAEYGLLLGTAFQLVDDVLDYEADPEETGKDLGDDLAEGKPTLPLIRAMQVGDPAQRELISRAIVDGDRGKLDAVLGVVRTTDALAHTRAAAQRAAAAARVTLEALPASEARRALEALTHLAVERRA
jgi:octaprenyl-diphosphate synthase